MNRCIVMPIHLSPHPEVLSLRIGKVGESQVIVGNHYDEGTLGFFIPSGALVPDKLAEEMLVKGRLSGGKKNRVKSRTIAGVQSCGLFYGSRFFEVNGDEKIYQRSPSWDDRWKVGDDVTDQVGVIIPC